MNRKRLYNRIDESEEFPKLKAGQVFMNPNGVKCSIVDIEDDAFGDAQVTYMFDDDPDTTDCHYYRTVDNMLNRNDYTLVESKKIKGRMTEGKSQSDILKELASVLDYYQGDESLDDKSGYLIEQSLGLLDLIEDFTDEVNIPEGLMTSVLDEADNYAENLEAEGFDDEADEIRNILKKAQK